MVGRDAVERAIEDVDELAIDLMNRHLSPGLALSVVHDGEVVVAKGFGTADLSTGRAVTPDTVFRIGSTSKTFTAIALMQLWEQGQLDLEDPVSLHLTSYQLHQPAGSRPVTIRDMLTHTSGSGEMRRLTDARLPAGGLGAKQDEPIPTLAQWYARGLRTEVPPGQKWAYGNHAVATLGQVVEDVSGQPFDQYVRERIFEPLGMMHTDFLLSERVRDQLAVGYQFAARKHRLEPVEYQHIVVGPAGSGFSTANDMASYMSALMNGGSNQHGTVLKPDTLERMYEPLWEMDPRLFRMGAIFMLEDLHGHHVVHHGGGWKGFLTMMRVAPDDGVGVFAVTNAGGISSWHVADLLLRRILDVPQVGADLPVAGVLERPDLWDRLVGVYRAPRGVLTNARIWGAFGGEIEVLVHHGKLHARSLRGTLKSPVRLYPSDRDDPLFFRANVPHGPCPVEAKFLFEVGDDGRAVALRGDDFLPFQLQRGPRFTEARRLAKVGAGITALAAAATARAVWRRHTP